jgi:integrase
VRNARSLFTSKALAFAGKRLALPDPLPFSGVKLESRRATTRYSSRIDPGALLVAAKTELSDVPERQEQFKIFCLALLCGLRKREIDTLLWRSVDFAKGVIRIERTEYFQPKSEDSAAEVDIAPEFVEILRGFQEEATGEFVIESPNPPRYHTSRTNYRAEADFEALYTWLATKGVAARKKLHELRKECGAVIANSMGIFAASRVLRHSDIRITSQYYADKKVRITTGLDALLSSKAGT